MNAGKSTLLLQSSYNYRERGMHTLLFMPAIDTRYGNSRIASRIGLASEAESFTLNSNLLSYTSARLVNDPLLKCVLVDEAQFLTKKQVTELTDIVDNLNIPVLAYGLRTDFSGEPFEGSQYLLAWADNLIELKTICHCGRKATMVVRVDHHNQVVRVGEQIEIGGNDRYVSVCRLHFKTGELCA